VYAFLNLHIYETVETYIIGSLSVQKGKIQTQGWII